MDFGLGSDKVVAFSGVRKDMRFPAVSEVRAYWEALRGGRLVPLRSEIDPRGIERALEYAFVLERIAPQVARFRLAGLHLSELMGMEVRGMPLTAFFVPEARAQIAACAERVFRGPEIAELTLEAEGGLGRPALAAKLLILPLRSDLGDVSRALGCLASEGRVGRTPRRFRLAGSAMQPVASGRLPGKARPLPAGLAEDAAPFDPPAPGERPYLRLVRSKE
jgi:hypothetical protein